MKSERVKIGNVFLIPSVISDNTAQNVICPQVKQVVMNTQYYLVENIRTARRFISSLKLGITIDNLNFQILDKKTDLNQIKENFKPVFEGYDIGILSEAGCPGVADPGSLAVHYAHQQNIKVVPLVGPSSILLALMASGFSGQSFVFHGYVPIDNTEKEKFIKEIELLAIKKQQTQLFMDTPYRNDKLFQAIINACQDDTLLCITKDITGENEMILSKNIKSWKKAKPALNKYPVIFLLFGE
ncbi:MAG: SAM-dependent methyltransferase [Bacteroidota bacterium]|nr:SAM-dependent methyltransferase [Bacteroidota bacterium]